MYKIYSGKITNNDDPLQIGRVQIKLIPEMEDISDDSLLPWIRPFILEQSSTSSYSNHIPNVGEMVFCLFLDDFYKNGYWIGRNAIDGFFNHEEVKSSLSNIDDINIPSYPQPEFIKYSDGSIIFRNNDNGETGIVSSGGSYAIMNSKGEIILNNGINYFKLKEDTIEILNNKLFSIMNNDGTKKVNIDFETGKIEIVNDSLDIITGNIIIRAKSLNSEILVNENTSLKEIKTVSNEYFENIGGTKKEVIGEDKVQTIVGNDKKIIVGNQEITLSNLTSTLTMKFGAATLGFSSLGNVVTINTNGGSINII
jgi:hypothetical protein